MNMAMNVEVQCVVANKGRLIKIQSRSFKYEIIILEMAMIATSCNEGLKVWNYESPNSTQPFKCRGLIPGIQNVKRCQFNFNTTKAIILTVSFRGNNVAVVDLESNAVENFVPAGRKSVEDIMASTVDDRFVGFCSGSLATLFIWDVCSPGTPIRTIGLTNINVACLSPDFSILVCGYLNSDVYKFDTFIDNATSTSFATLPQIEGGMITRGCFTTSGSKFCVHQCNAMGIYDVKANWSLQTLCQFNYKEDEYMPEADFLSFNSAETIICFSHWGMGAELWSCVTGEQIGFLQCQWFGGFAFIEDNVVVVGSDNKLLLCTSSGTPIPKADDGSNCVVQNSSKIYVVGSSTSPQVILM